MVVVLCLNFIPRYTVFPYTNGRLFDPSLPEFTAENAEEFACGCFNATLAPQRKGAKATDGCDATGAPGYYRYGSAWI